MPNVNWDKTKESAPREYNKNYWRDWLPGNYGFADGQWTLTDLIRAPEHARTIAFQVILGTNAVGRLDGVDRPLMDQAGQPFRFRLEILTRQACCADAAGTKILNEEIAAANNPGAICPTCDELPEPGDRIEWKDRMRPPDKEPHLSATQLRDWQLQGIREYLYLKYTVDADRCILAPFDVAQAMLTRRGDWVFPEFRRQGLVALGQKPARKISNRWFREVPPDYRLPQSHAEPARTKTAAK